MEELEQIRQLHQHWISQHPYFYTPKSGISYSDILDEIYISYKNLVTSGHSKTALSNATYMLKQDIKEQKKIDNLSIKLQDLEKQVTSAVETSDEHLWAFITIGFNEQTITPKKMYDVSDRISKLKYFKTCYYVLEKHRENGIHHHTHFLVQFFKKEYKSKLIDWIYQSKGLKEVCLGKNFIDIKGPLNGKQNYQTYNMYLDYINGNKKDAKLKYVDMDKIWRKENNLDH